MEKEEGLPDFSDVLGKHASVLLTTLTHMGDCRSFRLEREVEQMTSVHLTCHIQKFGFHPIGSK